MGGLHLEASRLRIFCLVVAIAATGALIITLAVGMPGQVRGPGPNGMPPPPPDLRPLANITIVTGLFVLAWLAALVVYCRDQIMQRLGEMEDRSTTEPEPATQRIAELFTGLRAELAADRERELTELSEQIAAMTSEYGEQRETDGYLNGMRVATAGNQPPEQKLRAVRRTSPPA